MNSSVKTPEQVEFTDLMKELHERFGFNQSRIAHICRISPSMVSQIVKGERSPGEPSLELLRMAYRDLTQPREQKAASGSDVLRQQLEYMEKHNPPGFEAAKAAVGALYRQSTEVQAEQERRRAQERHKASSASIPAEALGGVAAAEGAYEHARAQREQKPQAGAPSAPKAGPRPSASGVSKAPRPAPPGRARK